MVKPKKVYQQEVVQCHGTAHSNQLVIQKRTLLVAIIREAMLCYDDMSIRRTPIVTNPLIIQGSVN